MDSQHNNATDEYTDYKGRKADPRKHGGIKVAAITCVVEVLENTVFLGNAINFVVYFMMSMHYPAATSANMVTNFMGTSFLLTIVAGFISDSFITRFTTFIISCFIEIMGLILLNYQARHPQLQPRLNETPSHGQAAFLYIGLYAIAIGVAGIKATLPANGADQIDHNKRHLISSFFNWFFFSLCTGGLIASTVMVWVEENHGWKLSFMLSAIILCITVCVFASGFKLYRYKCPTGSPLTRMIKVFASSARNAKASIVESRNHGAVAQLTARREQSHDKFKFLNKALIDGNISVAQVEETKSFLGLLPIFATTILMNCCVAQLQTFSIQQGSIMNRKIHNFTIPAASLTVIPTAFIISFIPLFEQFKRIHGHKHSNSKVYQSLPRIGVGLALASVAMAMAALIEAKRREAMLNGVEISVFWLSWQYLLVGVSDTLTLGGMLDFFYSEAPDTMRSMCTSLSWCSTSMGYFLSSVLVAISNSVSGRFGREWLGGQDLNHARLDLFYVLLCILNIINFFFYVYCAKRY